MRDAFSDCHPIVNFTFYIGAFVMGMCFIHPLFLGCSLLLSFGYFSVMNHKRLKYFLGMMMVITSIVTVNPLFNTQGEQVLFTYFGDRPYTFEALCYGIALGAMFVTILTWFATYNQVMTSDKFLYCFGRLAPAVSLVLTMILRLVPIFQKKTTRIAGARKCIGKGDGSSCREKAELGMTTISALTSWALEGGIVLSDSMQSRGFGTGKRTSFSIYQMKSIDKLLLGFMSVMGILIIICAWNEGMEVTYTPKLQFAGITQGWTMLGGLCYFGFLSIPTTMHIMEELKWRILKSRI